MAEILTRIVAAFLFAGLAGGLTSGFLTLFGDKAALYEKRLTASPFTHVTLSGIFLAIAFRSSWILAMPFTKGQKSIAPIMAVFAAMAVTLALVPLLDLARSPLHAALPRSLGYSVLATLENLQHIMVNGVVLGLLPLPGLWLGAALPALFPRLEKRWRRGMGWGLAMAAILLILGWFPDTRPLLDALKLV